MEAIESILASLPHPSSGIQALGMSVAVMVAALALHLLLRRVRYRLRRWQPEGSKREHHLWLIGPSVVLVCLQISIWLAAILYVTGFNPVIKSWRTALSSLLLMTFTAPILTIGGKPHTLLNLLKLRCLSEVLRPSQTLPLRVMRKPSRR